MAHIKRNKWKYLAGFGLASTVGLNWPAIKQAICLLLCNG